MSRIKSSLKYLCSISIKNNCSVDLQWLEHYCLDYHGYFELVLESIGKNPIAADLD